MGAITGLLFLPILVPMSGIRFLVEELHDEAEAIVRDEGRLFAELIALSMRRSTGDVSETEYVEQEADLLERLNAIREYRNELLQAQSDDAVDDEEEW